MKINFKRVEEKIYRDSPYWVRDLIVSAYGQVLRQRRYGGHYREEFETYQSMSNWTLDQLLDEQSRRLEEFGKFVKQNSKYYADKLPTLLTRENLRQVPLLEKNGIRNDIDRFATSPIEKGLPVSTSGSTGSPMRFYFTKADVQSRNALLDAWRSWFGVRNGDRRATFSGRVVSPSVKGPGPWQTNFSLNQRIYSTYHMSSSWLIKYIEDLNDFQPAFLDGYPSAFVILAKFILSQQCRLKWIPRVIFVTAETLQPEDRKLIEEAFGCPVRNQYASSEGVPFIVECERGHLHFLPFSGVMEIVDQNGMECERGEGLFTSFHTHLIPLIRYRIGDEFAVGKVGRCECGRELPLVSHILGRKEDVLVGFDGQQVGRLDPVLKGAPHTIVRSQIVQTRLGEIDLLYIADKNFKSCDLDEVVRALKERLGQKIQVNCSRVDEIPLGPNGKFKAVVNRMQ